MGYYDSIKSPSAFRQRAHNKRNFSQLYTDARWKSGASGWDVQELIAARVICTTSSEVLGPLASSYPSPERSISVIAQRFIRGPSEDLTWKWEPSLVKVTESESLGFIWAALGPFLRSEHIRRANDAIAESSSRPIRQAALVAQAAIQQSRASSTTSGSSGSMLGYGETGPLPLMEDATVRLVSSICRLVLNADQRRNKAKPFLCWRDKRISYRFKGTGTEKIVSATDDGGIQMWDPSTQVFRQVALLEAKRTLEIRDGNPYVTDQILAQLVGETLALRRSEQMYVAASPNLSFSILASGIYIKFFAFEFDENYLSSYENQAMDVNGCYLRVHSTLWMSVSNPSHRPQIVETLLALIKWADDLNL